MTGLSLFAVAVASPSWAATLSYNKVSTVSLTGAAYVNGTSTTSSFVAGNAGGDIVGTTTAYTGATSLGNRYFLFDASAGTTSLVGFYDGLFQPTTGTASSSVNSVYGLDAAGDVVGYSNFYNGGASAVGQSAWVYNPNGNKTTTRVGLTDTASGYTSTGGRTNSTAYGSNISGAAAGLSLRYNGSETGYFSANLGTDAFYYSPSTGVSTLINLTDAAHTSTAGVRSSNMSLSGGAINNNGKVYGSSVNYNGGATSVGSDLWVYDAATNSTNLIAGLQTVATASTTGFIGSGGTRTMTLGRINNNNIAVGTAGVYLANTFQTQTAFAYNAGDGTFRTLTPTDSSFTSSAGVSNTNIVANLINDHNDVVISAARYNGTTGLGRDVVIYNYTTNTYKTVNPTGGNFEISTGSTAGTRNGTATFLSSVGDVGGTATYYNTGATAATGNRAFYYNHSTQTSAVTGLSGTDAASGIAYGDANGAETSAISAINASGLLAGVTQRAGGIALQFGVQGIYGQDAFVYNSATGTTTKLQGFVNGTGWAYSQVLAISDSNIAVGFYSKNADNVSTVVADQVAFAWTPTGGMVDLGLTVTPSLSADGWQSLAKGLYVSASGDIYSLGLPNGFAAGSTAIALLTNTPEPTSLAAFGLLGAMALRRRRGA